MVIITIIGVVAPGAYFGATSYFSQAHDLQRKKDLKNLELVMEYYYDAASAYPSTIPSCNEPFMLNDRVLLDSFPCDPMTHEPYVYLTDSLTGYQWYKIYTKLERNNDLSIPLVGCSQGCGPECAYNFGVASSNISITSCIWSGPRITPIPTEAVPPTLTPTVTPIAEPTLPTVPIATPVLTPTPEPSPAYLRYVCAPGGGQIGYCEVFDDPDRSLCPFVFPNDATCQDKCDEKNNRCKNSSGKYKPY